jgi:hypothetical protein
MDLRVHPIATRLRGARQYQTSIGEQQMLTIAGGILIAFFVIIVLELLCDDGRDY